VDSAVTDVPRAMRVFGLRKSQVPLAAPQFTCCRTSFPMILFVLAVVSVLFILVRFHPLVVIGVSAVLWAEYKVADVRVVRGGLL
jgi:hypothetical protein